MARRRHGQWWLVGAILIALALAGCGTASSSGGEEEESGLTNEGTLGSPVAINEGEPTDGMVGPNGTSYYRVGEPGSAPEVLVYGTTAEVFFSVDESSAFAGGENTSCSATVAAFSGESCNTTNGLDETWIAVEDLDGEGAEYTITVTFGGGG